MVSKSEERQKFHQANWSGSRVIVLTKIDSDDENNTAVASANSNNTQHKQRAKRISISFLLVVACVIDLLR